MRQSTSYRPTSFVNFRPRCVPMLQRALREGYQLSIEDIGFTDVFFQKPCNSGDYPHSRWNSEIDISGRLSKSIPLRLPIVSSSMPGVTSYEVAIKLGEAGGFAVLPRELPIKKLEEMIINLKNYDSLKEKKVPWYGAAVGVYPRTGPTAMEKVERITKLGVKVLFVETQQANSEFVISFCKELRRKHPRLLIGVGVFNSVDGVKRAIQAGVDVVKVGIGTGDTCLTSIMSGVTKGQVNTVFEIAYYLRTHRSVPVIVDGGTSTPGGAAVMMTILRGNGTIMLGSKIAAVAESDSKKIKQKTNRGEYTQAIIQGMGSSPIATKRGEPKNQRILEGTVVTKPVTESIDDLLLRYEGGFRTAMYGYHGAKNWVELSENAILGLNSPSNIIARFQRELGS